MTKTRIAEKVRHFSSVFRASLLLLVVFCSSVVLSDDFLTSDGKISCSLSGHRYTCVALSDDVDTACMRRIESLLNSTQTVEQNLSYANIFNGFNRNDAVAGRDALSNISPDPSESYDYRVSKTAFENIIYDCDAISNRVSSARSANLSTLDVISSFSCSDCSQSSSSCCCCSNTVYFSEFSSQLTNLVGVSVSLSNSVDDISSILSSIAQSFTNLLGYIGPINATASSSLRYAEMNIGTSGLFSQSQTTMFTPNSKPYQNVLTQLYYLRSNLGDTQASINNFLGYMVKFQLPSISNNIEHLYIDSTNFFSFFKGEVSVRPVLEDWTPDDGGYHNFLTNYYIRVVNNDSSLSSTSKTNWFSRIETLLASLVFADSVESTNTVDTTSATAESSTTLQTTLDGASVLGSTSSDQLTAFRDTSQNIVSSLRSISASFSRVADPGTVKLVSFSSSGSRDSSDTVSFETSDIRNLVEACHCVTTLCWCFAGLLLLYYFLHWTVKTSYGLLMFAWGVVSAIFKH